VKRTFLGFFVALLFAGAACGGTVEGGAGGSGGNGGTGGTGGAGGTGGGVDYGACATGEPCVITPLDCCGPCGEGQIDGAAAVASGQLQAYRSFVCSQMDVVCSDCIGWMNYALFGYCDMGQCVAADAREHAVSACSVDADCSLRYGADCCPRCTSEGVPDAYVDLVAVSNTGEQLLQDLVCGSGDFACDACLPTFPADRKAACVMGHCSVVPAP